jgi:hypothetical protein
MPHIKKGNEVHKITLLGQCSEGENPKYKLTDSGYVMYRSELETMGYEIILDHTPIVVENHTLGVYIAGKVQILRASILKGSPYNPLCVIELPTDYRLATQADFKEFKVCSDGYF